MSHPWKTINSEGHLPVLVSAWGKEELEMRIDELKKKDFELISTFEDKNVPKYVTRRKYYAKMKRCNPYYTN